MCRSRVDHRVQQLTSVLVNELKISPERSIKGGRRSARRAVAQLIRLGKSVQVSDTYSSVQCDFRFDLFLVLLLVLVFQLFFRFSFVLVFIIF